MRTINVTFEDKEHIELLKSKKEMNWRQFIISLNKKQGGKNEKHKF